MPRSVLTRKRAWIARIAALAMALSLLALPASAQIDTSGSCPDSIPSAGFTDIGLLNAETQQAINCLAAFGITQGTSATTYSPNLVTARWQMALFLIRQAQIHGIEVPAPTDQGFTDIGTVSTEAQNAINQLRQLGITQGTSATTFTPLDDVDRWEMALFLKRLAVAAGVTLEANPASAFTDISGLSAEAQLAINQLAAAQIALGVGNNMYDPFSAVSRWQMALFLTRVLAADNVPPPAGAAQQLIDGPELVSATEESYDDDEEELVMVFTFDEEVTAEDDAAFRVYEGDGTQYQGDDTSVDGDEVTVTFEDVDEDAHDALTVATVAIGAVEDNDGLVNPEGAVGLGDATIEGDTPELDDLNLEDVSWEDRDLGGGTSEFIFEYDEDLTVAAGETGWSIILENGEDEVECTVIDDGDLTDDEVTVECDAAIASDDWARGIDDGTDSGLAVLQAADERSSDGPDLVSVAFIDEDRAEFTFDEVVELFGDEDDSEDLDAGDEAALLALFQVYDETGDTLINPERVLVTGSNRVVRAEFDVTGDPFGADTDLEDDGVGGIVLEGAVQERFGTDPLVNLDDEARAGAGEDEDVASGRTLDPDLISVGDLEETGTDLEGDPDEWEVIFTFDEDVDEDDTCDAGEFRLYTEDGEAVEGTDCDADGDEVTVTFEDDAVEDAVLGGVGAAAVQADDNGDDNPEGSAPLGG